MSFGFSVGDIRSAITTASQFCLRLNQERRQFHQVLHELKLTLDGLVEAYKPTGLNIVFVADFPLCASNALQTIALFDRLLLSTGLGHASLDPKKFETTVEDGQRSRLQGSLRSLLSDLRERAQQAQLLLVCNVAQIQILLHALRNDRWLQGRVFAITMFETSQHHGRRCQYNGTVCCSEEGPDQVLWSIIRLLEENKKQSFMQRSECKRDTQEGNSAANWFGSTLQLGRLGRTQAGIRALLCVAFAFRPLHIDELLIALATSHTNTSASGGSDAGSFRGKEDFMELMSEVLDVRDNGLVFFKDSNFQHRVIAGDIEPKHSSKKWNGHEVLATICLQCLQCEMILKPWTSANNWLTDRGGQWRLHSYATAFWHEHCRLTENQSKSLPALLYRKISEAVAMYKLGSKERTLSLRDKTNSGLWVSAAYGLRTLCITYLQMGADLNFVNNWHKHAFQMLPSWICQRYAEPLLDIGEGPVIANGMCACFAADGCLVSRSVELQRARDPCHQDVRNMDSGLSNHGFSPLQMAFIYDHSTILQLFQEHPTIQGDPSQNLAPLALSNEEQRHALRLGHCKNCKIHCEASAVTSVTSQLCEFREGLERKTKVRPDCFKDVQHSFHCLALADNNPWGDADSPTDKYTAELADCKGQLADSWQPENEEWLFVTKDEGGNGAGHDGLKTKI